MRDCTAVHSFVLECTNTLYNLMVCKKDRWFIFTICYIGPMWGTELNRGASSTDCLVFLSLEPSWHGRLTVKPTQEQRRRGEAKQSWHLVHTRSWEVNDNLQGAKPSELSRDPAHTHGEKTAKMRSRLQTYTPIKLTWSFKTLPLLYCKTLLWETANQ